MKRKNGAKYSDDISRYSLQYSTVTTYMLKTIVCHLLLCVSPIDLWKRFYICLIIFHTFSVFVRIYQILFPSYIIWLEGIPIKQIFVPVKFALCLWNILCLYLCLSQFWFVFGTPILILSEHWNMRAHSKKILEHQSTQKVSTI